MFMCGNYIGAKIQGGELEEKESLICGGSLFIVALMTYGSKRDTFQKIIGRLPFCLE
jgi:hypothetical protein